MRLEWDSAPWAAAAALGGLAVAGSAPRPAPLTALLLLAAALAWRRPAAVPVGALAVGLLAGWGAPRAPPPDTARVVELRATITGHWRPVVGGWRARVESTRYRQGGRVVVWRQPVEVTVPGREPPSVGRRVRLRGLLRRSPGFANRPPRPPGPWRLVLKSRRFLDDAAGSRGAGPGPARWARRRVEEAMAEAGAPPAARLARALVLGDPGQLPAAWRRGLRALGLAHLTALSGLHVGLLAALCLAAGAPLPAAVRISLAAVAVAGFVAVAGARPALLRAAAMGAALAVALCLGRRPVAVAQLAVVAALLALARPRLLDDLGFLLSCSATAGILLLAPPLTAAFRRLPGWLARGLSVSLGAQLASLCWSLPAFALLVPAAPLSNLLAVPWTAVALAVCLAWCLAAVIWPRGAAAGTAALEPLTWPFAVAGGLPPTLTRPLPAVVPAPAAAVVSAAIVGVLTRPARRWPLLLVAAALLRCGSGAPAEQPELTLIDVGQGEAVLLRDGPAAVLVDGGGWRYGDLGGRVLVPVLASAGVRRLRAVVLTHPDLDHCHGLVDLLSYLPVAEVWTAPGWRNRCARRLLTRPGRRLRVLWAGEGARVGRWRLTALHPAPGDRRGANDRSLVLAARAPGGRVLLTGDLEAAGERRLVARWPASALRAEVLKLAHHGSNSSTTRALLAAVRPRLAIVSCGVDNLYGHPAPAVLARVAAARARLLRTDLSGAVTLRFDPRLGVRLARLPAPRPR